MQFIPDSYFLTAEVDLDLSHIYEGLHLKIQQPIDVKFIVLDASNTLIGYEQEPVQAGNYYHPQPGTDFVILGQLFDNDGSVLPLLDKQHLLSSIVS